MNSNEENKTLNICMPAKHVPVNPDIPLWNKERHMYSTMQVIKVDISLLQAQEFNLSNLQLI